MTESLRLLHPGSPCPASLLATSRSPVAWGRRRGAGRACVAARARGGVCAQPARRARPPGPSPLPPACRPPAWRPTSSQPRPCRLLTWRPPPAARSAPLGCRCLPSKFPQSGHLGEGAAQGDGFLKLCLGVALLPAPLSCALPPPPKSGQKVEAFPKSGERRGRGFHPEKGRSGHS